MDNDALRQRMVDDQIVRRGISDDLVIRAMRKVPRHLFVPGGSSDSAYADMPLPIGEGQTISQPYIVALMTETLGVQKGDKVLEIGTGSGYQAVILSELGCRVYSVERNETIYRKTAKFLAAEGYDDIRLKLGDGTMGWQDEAPFDRIIVTAGAPDVPRPLLDQLSPEGKLLIPVGSAFGQVLKVIERSGGEFTSSEICGCVFVPLIGENGWKA